MLIADDISVKVRELCFCEVELYWLRLDIMSLVARMHDTFI
jgi:hypothetical protein